MVIPILQMRTLRHREGKLFVQSYQAEMRQSWEPTQVSGSVVCQFRHGLTLLCHNPAERHVSASAKGTGGQGRCQGSWAVGNYLCIQEAPELCSGTCTPRLEWDQQLCLPWSQGSEGHLGHWSAQQPKANTPSPSSPECSILSPFPTWFLRNSSKLLAFFLPWTILCFW